MNTGNDANPVEGLTTNGDAAGVGSHSVYAGNSNFIEQMVEHEFISRVIQHVWFTHRERIEVLRSEIDDYGYDIVLEFRGILRHIQLKTSIKGGRTQRQKLNLALTRKMGGCVVWIEREEDPVNRRFDFEYRFFGGRAGEKFPATDALKIAKTTKATAQGVKTERPNIREVPKSRFVEVADLGGLMLLLFGAGLEPTDDGQRR